MRRLLIGLATFALLMAFPSPLVTPALAVVDGGSCGAFSQTAAENYTCLVPDGVTAITYEVRASDGGAAWGGYYSAITPGGRGAKISGTLTVTPGETLYVTVGGTPWGYYSSPSKENGGGGGYSSIARMVGDTLTPLVIAGGGGGAGTADYNEPSGTAEAGRGGDGGTSGTGGGGAGGTGGSYSAQTNGLDGGTGTTGGAGGSPQGGAGGDVGQNGSPQITAEAPWPYGNNRPGAGGGGFGALGGRGNPTYWVPAGVPGAGGQGSTSGGGGGGGGYAGGGGGGASYPYAGGGGGGGSSLIPEGADAVIEAGSAHATLSGVDATPPTVTGSAKVKGVNVTVAWTVSETATVDCRLDDTTWVLGCGTSWTGVLPKGDHHLDLRATDTAGNTSVEVRVDVTVKSGKTIRPN